MSQTKRGKISLHTRWTGQDGGAPFPGTPQLHQPARWQCPDSAIQEGGWEGSGGKTGGPKLGFPAPETSK